MINEYFKENENYRKTSIGLHKDLVPAITCADGFKMSVQASSAHYCLPRVNKAVYTHVEVGFPSEKEDLLMDYAEDAENPTKTVYSYVPVEIVEGIIMKHGGMKNA